MCLSAPASFTVSAVLVALGTVLVCRVKTKVWLPLALIPWFFALQQCAEGVVWMYAPVDLQSPAAVWAKSFFLFFAYVFWPVWLPFSIWLVEKEAQRKLILAGCLGLGIGVAAFYGLSIPLMVAIPYRFSIHYGFLNQNYVDLLEHGNFYTAAQVFYVVSTVIPLFISSLKKLRIIGGILAITGAFIYYVDQLLFTSLWCFFAAVVSVGLYFVLKEQDR